MWSWTCVWKDNDPPRCHSRAGTSSAESHNTYRQRASPAQQWMNGRQKQTGELLGFLLQAKGRCGSCQHVPSSWIATDTFAARCIPLLWQSPSHGTWPGSWRPHCFSKALVLFQELSVVAGWVRSDVTAAASYTLQPLHSRGGGRGRGRTGQVRRGRQDMGGKVRAMETDRKERRERERGIQ